MTKTISLVAFTADEAREAFDSWGANCGPGAIAAVLEMSLTELRPFLGNFESKKYTDPDLMWRILESLKCRFSYKEGNLGHNGWPEYGLARIQWEGPWTEEGMPESAAWRKTHWVGVRRTLDQINIFDINAMSVGGWITVDAWQNDLVPWLLTEVEPEANGKWFITHAVEIVL